MILRKIQNQIESLYHFRLRYNVENFLNTAIAANNHQTKEILLVKQTASMLELGLFFDASVLKQLKTEDPFLKIGPANLQSFCIAIEGVSHFLYLLKHALEARPVTRLELELQGEVDKYLLTALLFYDQQGSVPNFLFSYLFEKIGWNLKLSGKELQRYQEANRYALRFCARLEENHIRHGRWHSALDQARHFYFLDQGSKIKTLTP